MTARFVGRAAELATLAELLARAESGDRARGGVVAIVGEPGAGKTALVDVATRSRPTAWARGREGGGAPPLWLWSQILGEPVNEPTGTGGTGADRFQVFDALARRLVEHSARERRVIVLDDLQWADDESLAFVDFFAPDAEQHAIVVIATVRRGELIDLPRRATVVELGGLGRDDVAQLLAPSGGTDGVDGELVESVWLHTGGNPFFIGEVERLLRSSGRESSAAQWRSIVPEGVRAVLARRFARLPQRANRALLVAAELGEVVWPPMLAAVLARDLDEVLEDLDAAMGAGLVRATAGRELAFSHSLVREVARAELPPGERRMANRRAAAELRARGDDRLTGQIAQHLWNAGDPEAGVWAERAGDAAYAASMYADATTWFERALDACSASAESSLRLRHARALSRCGRAHDAEPEFLVVATAARAAGDGPLLAAAALGVGSIGGGFEVRQLDVAQQALLAEAIAALQERDDADEAALSMLLARLSIASALDAGGAGHRTRAELAERALAMARGTGDDAAIGAALGAWCDAHAGPADIDARAVASAEMLVAAQRCGDAELELLARRLALVAALETGDIGMVKRHAAAFALLADGLRLPQFAWYARLIEGMLAHLAGDLDLAEALTVRASELGREARSANAQMLTDGALGPAIARDRGDPDFLERVISVNSGIPEATRGQDIAAPFHVYAVGYGATHDDVASGLPGWAAMWRSTGAHDGLSLFLGFHLARAAAFVGDAPLMAEAGEVLGPHAARFALDGTGAVCYGPVSAALAAIAAARGEAVLAQQHYRAAVAACRRIGAPLLQARFAAELAALGAPGAPAAPAAPVAATRRGTLRRDGDVWLVAFGEQETRLKHAKGLADLAVLLAAPERDIHVFDLIGATGADRGDAGTVIDATARAAYEERIRALTAQIEAADGRGDDARAAALDDERAQLITHLAGALGLGRRPRTAGSDVERARKAVGMRLRDACRRIERELPELGRHLHSAVRTGTWCSYRPDITIDWTF